MLLSAVSVLVVAQSSSEIPEGLMNNPVYNGSTPVCQNYRLEKSIKLLGMFAGDVIFLNKRVSLVSLLCYIDSILVSFIICALY